jgi:myosin heavy subunit
MDVRALVDDVLAPSNGHFIRCIKPNGVAQRFKLDDTASMELTLSQLSSCGVLEAAQISAAGTVRPTRVRVSR